MLCPDLIGREAERGRIGGRLAQLGEGGGGVVVVVGPAGAGKSRLLRDALASGDVGVLAGRAVPAEVPVPYRPLIEAFLAVARGRDRPVDPSLVGFEGQLGRLVPAWGGTEAADDSPVLLGEAVVRLLQVLSSERPQVLVIEDLHWADPETLAVVEYLSEALAAQRSACLCTTRPAEPAVAVVERLRQRDPSGVVALGPLAAEELDAMVAACLDTDDLPAGLGEFVLAHSDGNPFLVEELLAGLVAAGTLVPAGASWAVDGALTPAVPASLRESITRRLEQLDPTTRRVLGAASLLGRIFEWDLLPGIAELDGRATADALRAAVDAQFVAVEGDGFRFRHALTREAILDDLLPPERRELAGRAWPAFELAHPQLPGATCQLAADLAEAAGERPAAAVRLVECTRRALAAGALASAEATGRRARALADADPGILLDAEEALVDVLVAAGKPAEALALGRGVAERLAAVGPAGARRADLLVGLVRAAVAAGELDEAGRVAEEAQEAIAHLGDIGLAARVDAVSAELALDRSELSTAEELSRRAIAGARATRQPAVECEALLVLGRILRTVSREQAGRAFREAEVVAETNGLVRWHLRARQELSLDSFQTDPGQVHATRDLAVRYGAHHTVAVMDLVLADLALGNFEREACERSARTCIDASRRLHLATEPVAHLWLAGAHALGGDDEAMHVAISAALERNPDDPRLLADLYGRVLATRACVRGELDELPALVDQMMEHVRRGPPAASIYPGRVTWVVLHTIHDDDHGRAARSELRAATTGMGVDVFAQADLVCEALAGGRAGDAEAAAVATRAHQATLRSPVAQGMMHVVWLLAAGAAIRDGWGDPASWLRQCEAWFAERHLHALVRQSRTLLATTGAPVSRRGRGESEVPTGLRALGVTSREVDVLKLVVDGCTNRQIADALFLSPKTVERHLSSLFDRTGVRDRRELARVGATHLR